MARIKNKAAEAVKAAAVEADTLLNDLRIAKKQRYILTGEVNRIVNDDKEKDPFEKYKAVIDYKGMMVTIPASKMGIVLPPETTDADRENRVRAYLLNMVGSSIEFILTELNVEENILLGSREGAMALRRKVHFFRKNAETGKSKMEEAFEGNVVLRAKVISIHQATIRVELFGVDCLIHARDIAYHFIENMQKEVQIGSEVPVKIMKLEIDHENKVVKTLELSIKAAIKNVMKDNLKRYSEGDMVLAQITRVAANGCFVHVSQNADDEGIDAFAYSCKTLDVPTVGDMVVFEIRHIDMEKERASGVIQKIVQHVTF